MRSARKTFVKVSAAAGATTYIAWKIGLPSIAPNARAGADPVIVDQKMVPSVCLQCPGMCGLLVRVVNGRAVKIEGNPLHPVNEGNLCPKGQAGLQVLYDPDRVKGPMKRVGDRGSGQWQPISWDEAVKELADRLRTLRDDGKAHTVVSISGRRAGQMTGVVETFMKAYGSPNHLRRGATCSVGGEKGYLLLTGTDAHRGHDWGQSNYILLFGYPMLEGGRPLTYNIASYAKARRGKPTRAKVVLVDPRMGTTAARADEWVPIKPGTDGAMALAMAHVILTQGLWDKTFVGDFTNPVDRFLPGADVVPETFREKNTLGLVKWWNLVLKDATPEWQEGVTGVQAAAVRRLAVEFATTKPAITDGGNKGTSSQSNAVYTRAAIYALNALVGSLEAPGGIITQSSYSLKGLTAVQDDVSTESYKKERIDKAKSKKWPLGGNVIGHVPTAILEDGYEVNLVLSYYANPFYSFIDTSRWREALMKVPYLVSFSPFMDDFSAYADLILPDHTYLERYQYQGAAESLGYPVLALRNPVVEPVYDTMDAADVFIRVAKDLGGKVAESLPYADNRALIDDALSKLKPEELESLQARGVISSPPYKFGDYSAAFKTPSKKFEFESGTLKATLDKLHMTPEEIAQLGVSVAGDAVYLPHYEPVRMVGGSASEYPLVLNTYKLTVRGEGRTSDAPHLNDVLSPIHHVKWDTWVEIHPDTAEAAGLGDGDAVWVESSRGRIKTRAVVFAGCEPGTVSIPHHFGHREYGRYSKGVGVNPNDIIIQDYDYLCGQSAYFTRVKVYPAGGEA